MNMANTRAYSDYMNEMQPTKHAKGTVCNESGTQNQ